VIREESYVEGVVAAGGGAEGRGPVGGVALLWPVVRALPLVLLAVESVVAVVVVVVVLELGGVSLLVLASTFFNKPSPFSFIL
jgi:hypothetical protein